MGLHNRRQHSGKKKSVKQKEAPIDKWVYLAIIIGPILTIPQVWDIWVDKQKGVSLISWIAYLIASVIWLLYGLHHKDKAIISVETLWLVLELLIIIGIS